MLLLRLEKKKYSLEFKMEFPIDGEYILFQKANPKDNIWFLIWSSFKSQPCMYEVLGIYKGRKSTSTSTHMSENKFLTVCLCCSAAGKLKGPIPV